MHGSEYGNLVKRLLVRKGPGGALPDQLVWMESKDLEGLALNFGGGFHKRVGLGHTWAGGHTHSCNEILLFLGTDPKDISYFGGEVAVELGNEQEEHIINESSVVVVPGGLPHGPFSALRLDKPHMQYHVVLASKFDVTWMPKELKPPKTIGTKYSHLIKPFKAKGVFKPTDMEAGPGNADQLVWFHGKDLEGLDVNFTWGIYSKRGVWWREGVMSKLHSHPFDQLLIFVGIDPDDANYLGAEIEVEIGCEKHVFSKPTVVILPQKVPHGSITTKRVDKPFGCLVLSLSSEYIIG